MLQKNGNPGEERLKIPYLSAPRMSHIEDINQTSYLL